MYQRGAREICDTWESRVDGSTRTKPNVAMAHAVHTIKHSPQLKRGERERGVTCARALLPAPSSFVLLKLS
ncbi:hypothetical protein VNO80_28643 [Phaseolus coccineus]|uniref:Uncharacterized protein n=1 Tax=Phaseolus coccineus TaxID=3886 RepID=A0AAN9L9H3_PHACN